MDAGSAGRTLRTLDSAIASLQQLKTALTDESPTQPTPVERQGPYLNAPVWPWVAAGWTVGALFVLLFLVAWIYW